MPFSRHLPVNENQEYPQEGTGKGMTQKAQREGDGERPLRSAPSGKGNGAGPPGSTSDAGAAGRGKNGICHLRLSEKN